MMSITTPNCTPVYWLFSILCLVLCLLPARLRAEFRIVVVEEDEAPGTGGNLFGTVGAGLGQIAINDSGEVSLGATLEFGVGGVDGGNNEGVWTEAGGSLRLVAREGDRAPGTPEEVVFGGNGGFIGPFSPIVLSDSGITSFVGEMLEGRGGVAFPQTGGIWSDLIGGLAPVAFDTGQAPGQVAGLRFNDISDAAFNSVAQTVFRSNLRLDGNPANQITPTLWSGVSGSLDLLISALEPIPDGNGVPFGPEYLDSDALRINDAGETAFVARLNDGVAGVNSTNDSAILAQTGGTLHLVAREGGTAPGTGSAVFDSFGNASPFNASIFATSGLSISAGDGGSRLAFDARLVDGVGDTVGNENGSGIWFEQDGVLDLLVRAGDQAPGLPDGIVFDFFNDPIINAKGQIAFEAGLDDASGLGLEIPGTGIWVADEDGELQLVISEGDQAPGTPDGALFDFLFDFELNDAGQLLFQAELLDNAGGVVDEVNDEGLWATTRSGVLQLIARLGDEFDFDDGAGVDLQTIEFISEAALSDSGQVVFSVFTTAPDELSAVLVSSAVSIPEPSSVCLAVAGVVSVVLSLAAARRPLTSRPC